MDRPTTRLLELLRAAKKDGKSSKIELKIHNFGLEFI
jgi:hypothetical protein